MSSDAWAHYPYETGGILLGRTTGEAVIVQQLIGAGPDAQHERYNFTPDTDWQVAQVASAWGADSSIEYLGDWHTHPEGTTRFSPLDERTARDIADHPDARQPQPVMVVLALSRHGHARLAAAQLRNDRLKPMSVALVRSGS